MGTPVALSAGLAQVLGQPYLSRSEVVKGLWAYIREHDLQDPKDRRNIILDDSRGHGSSLTADCGASFGSPRCCPICLFIVNIVRGSSKSFPRESSRMMLRRSLGSCRSCSPH